VTEEHRTRLEELKQATTEEERRQLEEELAADPVLAQPPSRRLASTRFAFGPFLALSLIEYQLLSCTEWYRLWLGGLN
jgi:hypothetical protein